MTNDLTPADDAEATGIMFYVVYFNTRDFPGQHVVRRQFVAEGSTQPQIEARIWFEGLVGGSLAAARASLPQGLTHLPRQRRDDPTIVEVWMS